MPKAEASLQRTVVQSRRCWLMAVLERPKVQTTCNAELPPHKGIYITFQSDLPGAQSVGFVQILHCFQALIIRHFLALEWLRVKFTVDYKGLLALAPTQTLAIY